MGSPMLRKVERRGHYPNTSARHRAASAPCGSWDCLATGIGGRVTKRLITGLLLVAAAALALTAAGCGGGSKKSSSGGGGGNGVTALPASSCSPVQYKGSGKADYLIASDLPLIGGSRQQTTQMNKAIAYVLDQQGWKAGKYKIAFQACNDASAQLAKWDPTKCSANAHAYAGNSSLLGVIGTYNSGCAAIEIPVLNKAPGGGLAMVSPGNTYVCLTEPGSICKPDEPDVYYPSGKRNYIRVVPNDAVQMAGLATFANEQGIHNPFILVAAKDPTSKGQADTFEGAAKSLGMSIAGVEQWDPDAKSYTDLMDKVKASGADSVLLAGLLEQNGAQIIKDKVS